MLGTSSPSRQIAFPEATSAAFLLKFPFASSSTTCKFVFILSKGYTMKEEKAPPAAPEIASAKESDMVVLFRKKRFKRGGVRASAYRI